MKNKKLEVSVESENVKRKVLASQKNESRQDDLDKSDQSDFLLKQYSLIIFDEVHVRSYNTDMLMGILLRVSIARQEECENQRKWMLWGKTLRPGDQIFPLKLVLTSAMSRVEDFVRKLFCNLPILEVETRQFKCEMDDDELGGHSYDSDTKSELENYGDKDDDGDALCQDTDDLEACSNQSNCSVGKIGALLALPLYTRLPAGEQSHVFKNTAKEGERLLVMATNFAEISLTIDGIKYVVDAGKEKDKDYNSSNDMETYNIQ
ncbi:hypothetical protein EV1_042922 [Malus domestica]